MGPSGFPLGSHETPAEESRKTGQEEPWNVKRMDDIRGKMKDVYHMLRSEEHDDFIHGAVMCPVIRAAAVTFHWLVAGAVAGAGDGPHVARHSWIIYSLIGREWEEGK